MKQQRSVKPGCFFIGLRAAGFGLMGLGCLLFFGALAGFGRTLIVSWPDLLSGFQSAAQQPMARFVLTLIFVWLGVFIILGLLGIILVAVGIALNFFSTEKQVSAHSVPVAGVEFVVKYCYGEIVQHAYVDATPLAVHCQMNCGRFMPPE